MRSLLEAWHPSRRWMLLLALVEFVGLLAMFHLAAWLRFLGRPEVIAAAFGDIAPRATLFAAILVLSMLALGMYVLQSRDGLRGQLIRAAIAFAAGGTSLVIVQYAFPVETTGRGVLAIALGLGLFFVLALRTGLQLLFATRLLKHRVLVLGAGERASLINTRLRRQSDRRTFELVGFVDVDGEAPKVPEALRVDASDGLLPTMRRLGIDELVIAPDERRGRLPMHELVHCRLHGIRVLELSEFFERETGRIKLAMLHPAWLVYASGFDSGLFRRRSKRLFDVVASLLMLVLAAPLMVVAALAIVLESGFRGPVFYRQERVSQGGRPFNVVKFRSMRTDAESDGVARWATSDDDRVTRVGQFMRKTRIDELPQLFNVLAGDMSFVGPRPERPVFVESLSQSIPYYQLRHAVKPGITGWAQLRYAYGASVEDAEAKLEYDLYYIRNQSLVFDMMVLLQTVEVVVFGKGAR